MTRTELLATVSRANDVDFADAEFMIREAQNRLDAGKEDPQDILEEELGLELDYLFDVMEF